MTSRVARALYVNAHTQTAFQLMCAIDANLCSHIMFQKSFQIIERQNISQFLSDRLELLPSIQVHVY